jgi:hypothetical protein
MKIWNQKDLDLTELRRRFLSGTVTLGDLAKQYNCAVVTIKRKLRSLGVDTSLHNHSPLAKARHRQKVCAKTEILTEDFLRRKLIMENLDTKTLSEQLGVHYSVIRARAQAAGIRKSTDQLVGAWQSRYLEKHGCLHPSQDPRHKSKYSNTMNRARYLAKSSNEYYFKSIMELSFALYLDYNSMVWDYEKVRVPYVHHITGKSKVYTVDFVAEQEWIEVKPHEHMIPSDKRLFAMRAAERTGCRFRGVSKDELDQSWELIVSGYRADHYDFIRSTPRRDRKQITYYFKDSTEMAKFNVHGYKVHHRKEIAPHIHKLVLRSKTC